MADEPQTAARETILNSPFFDGLFQIVIGIPGSEDIFSPGRMVYIVSTGGFPPIPEHGGVDAQDWQQRTIQITVRGVERDYEPAYDLAVLILEEIHKSEPADYTSVLVSESRPAYIGPDSEQRHRFVFNATYSILE